MNTLVLFHSKYGQTEKIARKIGELLLGDGSTVEVIEIGNLNRDISLAKFDAVVIGAPIYATRHSRDLARFIESRRCELETKQSGFFSVSLSAAGTQKQQDNARDCMNGFLADCHWTPDCKTIFAGGLPYRKYGWLTRFMMKRIVRKAGGDTDTSQNHEYTCWKDVEQFARRFAQPLSEKNGAASSTAPSLPDVSATHDSQALPGKC